tara:strand:+ start:19573 stop:20079 length:507 start_codon:yes stop_codon:yes gene_type:complete
MASYINEQILTNNLTIPSRELTNDIDNLILIKLKEQIEGICFEDGYIIPNSVKIIKRKLGKIKTTNNQSGIQYEIEYKAKIISPINGDELEIYVNNINKMGIVGYIRMHDTDSTSEDSPLVVMIPSEYLKDSSYNIEDINVGQKLNVTVIGSRIKFKSDKIPVIAKVL